MKKLEDFTLEEYDKFNEIINSDDFSLFEIMLLFGIKNPDQLELKEFERISQKITNTTVVPKQLKKEYKINGTTYRLVTMIKDIKSGQFIDFQIYLKNNKLSNILSVFLLPVEYKWSRVFKKRFARTKKYNTGYDLIKTQKDIYEHLSIGDANAIATFFLDLSLTLLPIIRNSLTIQMEGMKEINRRKNLKNKVD